MLKKIKILIPIIILAAGLQTVVCSQISFSSGDSIGVLLRNERSFSVNAHTQGLGFGYRFGNHLTGYKKTMYEGEFVMMKHPKEIKSIYPIDENAKSFVYGKLNSLFILRAGRGLQKVITGKPYWGGIEVRSFYFAGLSMGLTKPVYLYIYNIIPSERLAYITIEKYDPDKHSQDNIYGRAPFNHGLNQIKIHPGLYARAGFSFEFGADEEKIRSLETGLNLDLFLKPIAIMAFNKKNQFFLTVYLSYNFGKRYNKD